MRRVAASTNVSRRAVLSGGAATVAVLSLSGCTVVGDAGANAVAADVDLVEAALAEERAFGALCERLGRNQLKLAEQLEAVAAIQTAHADALAATLVDAPAPTTEPGGSSGTIRSVSRRADELHDRRMADCAAAEAGALAQLFASIAASHAVTARYWRTR